MSLKIGTDWKDTRAVGPCRSAEDFVKVMKELDYSIFNDMCTEERWYKVFAMNIQPYHQLRELLIELDSWYPSFNPRTRWTWHPSHAMTFQEDRRTLQYWREKLLCFLDDYMRGIRRPKIVCTNVEEKWLTVNQMHALEMVMTRNRQTAKIRTEQRNRSLSTALLAVKLEKKSKKSLLA